MNSPLFLDKAPMHFKSFGISAHCFSEMRNECASDQSKKWKINILEFCNNAV
jgi:hypothetical protein